MGCKKGSKKNYPESRKSRPPIYDLTGKTFGNWSVIGSRFVDGSGTSRWNCKCICGEERDLLQKHLLSGKSKSCGCSEPKGNKKAQWKGYGEISGQHWASISRLSIGGLKNSRKRSIPFEITIEYAWELFLKQDRKCSLSGIPLVFGYGKIKTASLDRIDSSKGYVEGNVQWVHKDINIMKNAFFQNYFIDICRKIVEHNKDIK